MKKVLLFLVVGLSCSLTGKAQHTIVTKDGTEMNVKITEIADTTLMYQTKGGKNAPTKTISLSEVESYKLKDGVVHHILPPRKDTIVSLIMDQSVSQDLFSLIEKQRNDMAKALKTSGIVSLSLGVPCAAAGIACLLYANLLPNPTKEYTISPSETDKTLLTWAEYDEKLHDFSHKTHAAEIAGYIMTPLGGSLMLMGIPLYTIGNKQLNMQITYTGNGAGLAVNF